jgi:pimeloyl-ACP methyl ester carboxylesterase/DNA-binding CsgD family transcriptional regulator
MSAAHATAHVENDGSDVHGDHRSYGFAVEQVIRFLRLGNRRLAYATVGRGFPLVVPCWWVSHLELEWGEARARRFFEGLARGRMLVRYDRLGVGLSDRELPPGEPSLEADEDTLLALLDHLEVDRCILVGGSSGGATAAAFAAHHPDRVEALVLYGTFEHGAAITSPEFGESLVSLVRAHWGAGSRLLADVFTPTGDDGERSTFARFQREAATAEVAAAMLEYVYRLDAREVLPLVTTPTLVVHRRSDSTIPYERGREVAALIPSARLVSLGGREHFPWRGDSLSVVRAIDAFVAGSETDAPQPDGALDRSPLTARELEALALVAAGLTDREIAAQLVVSEHTVHRHIANIRRKLGQSTRAAAAAEAARLGLI